MSEPHVLTYGTRQIAWTLLRRDRRTLEIAVTPEGAIEAVACPVISTSLISVN